jgi:hypothetical protein
MVPRFVTLVDAPRAYTPSMSARVSLAPPFVTAPPKRRKTSPSIVPKLATVAEPYCAQTPWDASISAVLSLPDPLVTVPPAVR